MHRTGATAPTRTAVRECARVSRQADVGIRDDSGAGRGGSDGLPQSSNPRPAFIALREAVWAELGADARSRYDTYIQAANFFAARPPHHHLNMIGVRRAQQHRGLARTLMEAVHSTASDDPQSAGVSLTNERAENLVLRTLWIQAGRPRASRSAGDVGLFRDAGLQGVRALEWTHCDSPASIPRDLTRDTSRPCVPRLALGQLLRRTVDRMLAHRLLPVSQAATMRTIAHRFGISRVRCHGVHQPRSAGDKRAGPDHRRRLRANVRRDVETLRAATNKYHELAAAEASFTTTMPKCIADSTMGGPGYHLIDRKSIDDKLEIEHPEMLIYAMDGEAKPELVAVGTSCPTACMPPARSHRGYSARSSSATISATTGPARLGMAQERGRPLRRLESRNQVLTNGTVPAQSGSLRYHVRPVRKRRVLCARCYRGGSARNRSTSGHTSSGRSAYVKCAAFGTRSSRPCGSDVTHSSTRSIGMDSCSPWTTSVGTDS